MDSVKPHSLLGLHLKVLTEEPNAGLCKHNFHSAVAFIRDESPDDYLPNYRNNDTENKELNYFFSLLFLYLHPRNSYLFGKTFI